MSNVRVLAETAYPAVAPSARVRLAGFAPFLHEQDVTLDYRPALTDDEYSLVQSPASPLRKMAVIVRSAARMAAAGRPEHDLLLVHRLRLLSPMPAVDPPRHLDVYDLDDALFLGSAAEVNRRFAWAKQEARRCIECLRRARLVTAGNSFLADRAAEYARRVEVVPSCVDPDAHPCRKHAETDSPVVGWIGSSSTSAYLRAVLPAVTAVRESGIDLRLVVIGADLGVREPWIEHRRWSKATEADYLAGLDIGVMPLPATEWARGKCGYKLLQYFAAGVPAVASPVGVNPDLIGDERGLLANGTQEWTRALTVLLSDAEERGRRGAAARAFVEREFSYQRWAPELASLYKELAA